MVSSPLRIRSREYVVASAGVAREFGLKNGQSDDNVPAGPNAPSLAARAEAGESLSLWGKTEGEQFAAAMAGGFLDGA